MGFWCRETGTFPAADAEQRIKAVFEPYHDAVAAAIKPGADAREGAGIGLGA